MAAGVSIAAANIPALHEQFEAVIATRTRPEQFTKIMQVDAELAFAQVDAALLQDLERLAPHGPGNPTPLFLSRGVTVVARRIVGERHLKLSLRQGTTTLAGIAFGMAEREDADTIIEGAVIDVLFRPEWNEWNGTRSLQLLVKDVRAHHTSCT